MHPAEDDTGSTTPIHQYIVGVLAVVRGLKHFKCYLSAQKIISSWCGECSTEGSMSGKVLAINIHASSQALENLKTVFTQARILGFPREEGQWYFDTEASDVDTRAVLFQIQDGEEGVIAYTSKSLEGSEHDELPGYAVSEHRGDTQHDDAGMADE